MAGRPSKLTTEQIEDIKSALICGESVKSLAIDYGVSIGTIYGIRADAGLSQGRPIYVEQFHTGKRFALELQ